MAVGAAPVCCSNCPLDFGPSYMLAPQAPPCATPARSKPALSKRCTLCSQLYRLSGFCITLTGTQLPCRQAYAAFIHKWRIVFVPKYNTKLRTVPLLRIAWRVEKYYTGRFRNQRTTLRQQARIATGSRAKDASFLKTKAENLSDIQAISWLPLHHRNAMVAMQ